MMGSVALEARTLMVRLRWHESLYWCAESDVVGFDDSDVGGHCGGSTHTPILKP